MASIERTVAGMGYDLVDVERMAHGLLRVTIAKSGPGLMTASKVIVMTAISSVMAYPVEKQRIKAMLSTIRPSE